MRYHLSIVGLLAGVLVSGCTSEPRSRLPAPNPDGTGAEVGGQGGVADLAGAAPPPIAENPPPTITAITPRLASAGGGTKITITGAGFDRSSLLFVNNALVFVDPDTVKPTELVATLPPMPGAFGPASVAVRAKDGRVGKNDPVKTPLSFYATSLSFTPTSSVSNPASPYGDATLADLDEDGNLDLVSANGRTDYSNPDSYTIWMGDGAGGFGDAIYRNVNCQVVQHVRVVDVNKDGHLDLVFPCNDSGYYIGVVLNRQSGAKWGNFGPATYTGNLQSYGNGCHRTTAVDVADFDGDGLQDLVIGCFYTSTIHVWRGNGAGSFAYKSSIDLNGYQYFVDMKAGDFDGDGKMDVAAVSAYNDMLEVVHGNGDGTLGSIDTYQVYQQPWHLLAADVNQDKKLDLVVSHRYDQRLLVLKNSGGSFDDRTDLNIPHQGGQLQGMDMNGDGILDLVVAAQESYDAQGTVLIGKGDGTFPGRSAFRGSSSSPWGVAVGRIDGDAKPDIVLLVAGNAEAQLLLSQ